MPNAAVRADARTLPHPPTDTIASEAPASPKSAIDDEYLRLMAEEIVASARLSVATEKRKTEKDKAAADAEKAEEDKQIQASQAFSEAYHAWLTAKAGIEDPEITDEEQPDRWRAQSDAERRLFSTPARNVDQMWNKLAAFETILGEEMTVGLRKESVLMLALGSIKQDIINLDLLEATR